MRDAPDEFLDRHGAPASRAPARGTGRPPGASTSPATALLLTIAIRGSMTACNSAGNQKQRQSEDISVGKRSQRTADLPSSLGDNQHRNGRKEHRQVPRSDERTLMSSGWPG